jgi:dihydrofolate reductase
MISAIVAVSTNNVIGASEGLPWYLPADLSHFKDLTTNHTVIMGRTTYESIVKRLGHGLPNRRNIVITRDSSYVSDYAEVFTSLADAIDQSNTTNSEVFIIGGAQIYELAENFIDKWYVTEVKSEIDGDVFLKGFDKDKFFEKDRVFHTSDSKNVYDYDFVTYVRR